MFDAIGRQQDLAEALRPDDRAAADRYDWMQLHTCPRDRIALKRTITENRVGDQTRLVPLLRKIPCCMDCWISYWQHEEPDSVLHNTPVIDLHPNQAA